MKKIYRYCCTCYPSTFWRGLADSDIGCGLGTMVFDGQQGKVYKVLGATTNGTSGNQTFGITFGTLGCDAPAPLIHSRS